jgi:hypothetical protein
MTRANAEKVAADFERWAAWRGGKIAAYLTCGRYEIGSSVAYYEARQAARDAQTSLQPRRNVSMLREIRRSA